MSENPDIEQTKIIDASIQLKEIQKYFPSSADSTLQMITKIEDYKTVFQTLFDMISQKIDNLSFSTGSADDVIAGCKEAWTEIHELQKYNYSVIKKANKVKNDARSERLLLRRSLCKAKSLALQDELSDIFKKLKEKTATLKKLKEEIRK